jgi:hypothetical protein
MGKDKINKDLCVCFEICDASPFSDVSKPALTFRKANYDFNKYELLMVKLRPQKITLDDKTTYVKVDEEAYINRSGESMLKIKYEKLG